VTSPFDGRSRRPLAWALAILCAWELWVMVQAQERSAPLWIVAAVGFVGLGLFALRVRPIVSGLAALTAMSVAAQSRELQAGGPMRHQYAVGVALLGWLCGLAWERRRPEEAEATAEMGAAAALAATYVSAGLSKLLHGGWAESATLRAMLVAHRRVGDPSLFGRYAQLIVENARFAEALSWATLVVQLGAVLYLVGPRWRALWGTLLLAFHLHVLYLTGISYFGAMYLLVVWSYPWPLPTVLGSK
jgi:hypothetical protein